MRSNRLIQALPVTLAIAALVPLGSGAAEAPSKVALRELSRALGTRDAAAVERAAVKVAVAGGVPSMKAVLDRASRMPPSEDALYWSLLNGAASFVDRPALEVLGKFIKDNASKAIGRDLLYALAKNPSAELVHALRPLATEGPSDLRLLAVTKLARIYRPAAVDALIAVLKSEEKASGGKPSALAWVATEGLTAMTGQEFGPMSVNWQGWWEKNRARPLRDPRDAEGYGQTGTAVDSLRGDRLRREAFVGVEKAPPAEVVVLSAIYKKKIQRDLNNDHMEGVLQRMRVPHTVVPREDFDDYDLSKAGIVLVNCAQFHEFCICPDCKPGGDKNERLYKCTGCNKHIPFSAKLTDTQVKKLADFVLAGGFLFCEDWVVRELVDRAFPDFVAAAVKLKQGSVDVVPARGMGTHPYLRGIFAPKTVAPLPPEPAADEAESGEEGSGEDAGGEAAEDEYDPDRGRTLVLGSDGVEMGPEGVKVKHTWTIDDESYAIKILDSKRVLPLLGSGALQKEAEGNGVVALAFRPGGGGKGSVPPGQAARGVPGVVVVVLSHFGKQDSREDEYSIQNLLLNVLIDASAARTSRVGPAKR